MNSTRRQLLWSFCIAVQWFGVIGIRLLPEEAIHFSNCLRSDECPQDSSCVETNKGYYCACNTGYYNDIERLTITHPGGRCTAICSKVENSSPCACDPGSKGTFNDKGLYVCKKNCAEDADCPADAFCRKTKCYCTPGLCNSKDSTNCVDLVQMDGKCTVMRSSIHETTLGTSLVTGLQTPQPAICPKEGSSSACICGPGSIKAKANGLHFCKDTCENDGDCPADATCQSKHCYCLEYLCNSRILSQCAKLVKLDEQCIEFITTTLEPTKGTSLVTGPKTTQSGLTSTTVLIPHTTPSEEMTTSTAHTSISSTLHITSREPSTSPQQPQTTQTDKRCQSHRSKELEKCKESMSQDALCNLLIQNAHVQETSCDRNDTNVTVQQVANKFTEILNHSFLNNMTTSELSSAVTSIVETVETSLLITFSKDPQNQNISTPELEVHMKTSADICGGGGTSITLTVLENTMQVPCIHVSGYRDGAMLISYKGLESLLNSSLLGAGRDNGPKEREEINSPIISGAITSPNTADLNPPVAFHLKQLKDVPSLFVLKCVFLDTELKIWSSSGCETKKSNRVNSTLCVCNHLSTFAVLMAPMEIQGDYGLIVISRIGLTVSLVCLCLSLLTFSLCQSIKSAHTTILKALCGCLFLGQLLALLGLHQTGNKVLCAVIAGLLQFSFLCAFCWMSLESALLFMTVRNLQAMNYMTSKRSLLPYACLAGFGIPLIIIIISAAIWPDAYGTEKYCWLRQEFVWSFLGPVCVFITINFILLVLTFALLKKKLASLNTNVSTLKHTRLLTFKALSQLFILGCTWIFGLFQFGSVSLAFSYIFTICNSLQGLYIFCVHCLLNHQVREEYRRGFRRLRSKKSDSEAMSGSTVPMTIKSSQASEVPKLKEKSVSAVENQYEL